MKSARSKMKKLIAPFLKAQASAMAEQITSAIASMAKADLDPDLVERILLALNFSDWSSIADGAQQILEAMAKEGGRAGLFQVGIKQASITDQVNEAALQWAKDRAAELVGMRNVGGTLVPNPDADWAITESTRDMLRSDVATAIEEGLSTADLADALEARYAFSADRAETISRTEIARADVEGNLIAYKESGVVSGKEWILGSEHVDSDECDDAAEMGVVPLDDDFGGIGDPPAHVNCVCDISPVVGEADSEQ